MNKMNIHMNQKNFLYFIIYGGIILIVILVGIVPLYLKASALAKENDKLKYQVQEQKELAPVYASLQNAMKEDIPLVLPHPGKQALPRSESGTFQTDLNSAAHKSGLKVISFTPDVNTSSAPSQSFLHDVVLSGEWGGLRKLLIELGNLAYLDKIESVEIQQGAHFMEFKIKIWIALK